MGENVRSDEHVEPWLDRFRTGELEATDRAAVAAHLAACSRCAEELERLTSFAAVVAGGFALDHAAAALPEHAWDRQRRRILARTVLADRERRPAPALLRLVPHAAVAVLAVIALGVLYREGVRSPADAERRLRVYSDSLDVRGPALDTEADARGEAAGTAGADDRAADAVLLKDEDLADMQKAQESRTGRAAGPPQRRLDDFAARPPTVDAVQEPEPERLEQARPAAPLARADAPRREGARDGLVMPNAAAGAARDERNVGEAAAEGAPEELREEPADVARQKAVHREAEPPEAAAPAAAAPAGREEDFARAPGDRLQAKRFEVADWEERARVALWAEDRAEAARLLVSWRDSLEAGAGVEPAQRPEAKALADSLALLVGEKPR